MPPLPAFAEPARSEAPPRAESPPRADAAPPVEVPSHSEPDRILPKIAGYETIRRLGDAPGGTVWEAIQQSTGNRVALKIFSLASLGTEEESSRFRQEVELAAGLEHPHIARIYECGQDEGFYHYAMELVNGVSLDRHVQQSHLNPKQILHIFQQICGAMELAHSHGVVHRDLKPASILIDSIGSPHILDFGQARLLHSHDHDATDAQMFASPEQLDGDVYSINPASNVYSIGAIAYWLLTKCNPHDLIGTSIQVIRALAQEEEGAGTVVPELDAELEPILMRAMAYVSTERYQTAGELGDDIDNYLHGRELAPVPVRKPKRRHRALVIASAAACAGIGLFGLDIRSHGWRSELSLFDKLIHISRPSIASAAPVSVPPVQTTSPITRPVEDSSMKALMANAPATRQSVAAKIWSPTAASTQPDTHGTVAVTGPIRAKAEALWRQVKNLDRGQGIGSQIDNAAAMRLSANALFDHEIFDAAGDSFQQLIKICGDIQAADANRKQAALARDRAKAAEVSAEAQGASDDAADLWVKAQSLDAQAKSQFEDGDFSGARASWEQAAKAGEAAGVRAAGVFQLREAQQQYETALANHDLERLDQYGGADWAAVKDAAARGAAGAQNNEFAGAATAYGDALRLLPAAVATADERWHKAEIRRIQPLVDEHIASAKDLIRRQINIAAMDEIQKALSIYANDETAKNLRASLLRTDVDGALALSTILPPQNFAGLPFQQCIQKLQDASGIQIMIDAKGFDEAGASKTVPITASFGRSRLEGVLDQLCGQLGGHMPIGYSVSNGVITLTRADTLAQRTQTIVYHVNDLCRNAADFQDLADRVAAEVDPVSWKSNGGTIGHTAIGPGSLVITQTQENQRLIDKFFQKLRMK